MFVIIEFQIVVNRFTFPVQAKNRETFVYR